MNVFVEKGSEAKQQVHLRVQRGHWPAEGMMTRVDLERDAVSAKMGAYLTPVNFTEHTGIYTLGLITCGAVTYLMGPAGETAYTHGAMSHVPSSLPGQFCSPQSALATVSEGGIEIKDVVIAVNGTPTNEAITRLHDFLIHRGIAEERIWAYDGQDIGSGIGVRRDGRVGMPFNYQ
jgi:hypothetical protein